MSSKNIYIYGSSTFQGCDGKYHYTYRITNTTDKKHYYGVRTSKINPYDDLGTVYLSSSKILKEKFENMNIKHFKFKVLKCFNNRKLALEHEMKLHYMFNVSKNLNFYNLAKQNYSNYDISGTVSVIDPKDKNRKIFRVSLEDPRYVSGELHCVHKNTVTVKDCNGNKFRVDSKDPRLQTGELVGVKRGLGLGKATMKDSHGNILIVDVDDPRIKTGELVGANKGINKFYFTAKDKFNNTYKICTNDPRFISGELVGANKDVHKDMVMVKDKNGKKFRVMKTDPRFVSGELVGVNKNKIWITNDIESRKIEPSETIPEGWRRGRKYQKRSKI